MKVSCGTVDFAMIYLGYETNRKQEFDGSRGDRKGAETRQLHQEGCVVPVD
jgi:hypothetical protein